MREGWATARLGDLAQVFTDGDWIESKDQASEGIRLIQTGNVGVGEFRDREEKARFISHRTFDRLNCTEVLPGDCLISRLPDPVGRCAAVPDLGTTMITAVDCTIVRFDGSRICPEFFRYYAQSVDYLSAVERRCTGSTRKRISRKNLGRVEVPLPSLTEQRRIVAILDEAFAALEAAKAATIASAGLDDLLLDAVLEATLGSWQPQWKSAQIGEICETTSGGTPRRSVKKYFDGGDIPWILSGEVCQRELWQSRNFITDAGLANSSAKIFSPGSVLVAMYGATAGQVAILRTAAATNQAVCGILPNEKVSPEFLYYVMRHRKSELVARATGNAQPNISQKKIRDTLIPVPPIREQLEVANRLTQLEESVEQLRLTHSAKLAALTELKQSILHKAFTGQLTSKTVDELLPL